MSPSDDGKSGKGYIREAIVIIAIAIGLYLYLSIGSYSTVDDATNIGGNIGHKIAYGLLFAFGKSAYLVIFFLIYALWQYASLLQDEGKVDKTVLITSLLGLLLLLISTCGLEALRIYSSATELPEERSGGFVGFGFAKTLYDLFGFHGSSLILLGLWLSSLSLFAMFSWLRLCDWLGGTLNRFWLFARPFVVEGTKRISDATESSSAESSPKRRPRQVVQRNEPMVQAQAKAVSKSPAATKRKQTKSAVANATGKYETPSAQLLSEAAKTVNTMSDKELRELAATIEAKLAEFGVQAKVEEILPGPVVTRYEIQPATGVKGSQIVNLVRDLSRALSVSSIRVLETIPGKTTMGLEVPNDERQVVGLHEVINSAEYQNSKSPLTLALGRDIAGRVFVANLEDMPHLLVAGTTGAGKSVQINSMILSILFRATPEEVRFILVDPKVVELAPYDGLPHLLAPVVSDMGMVPAVLAWSVQEMERRYQLMAKLGVRNLKGLNEAINGGATDPETGEPLKPLYLLVIIVDELADLMAVAGKKVEQLISRLAQKARAAGIHLILATQRPSVDVITGLIKANVPSRIAFQVSSRIDSRTILDQGGAETLLGKGDMLYLPGGHPQPTRVHGAFVSDEEVRNVIDSIKAKGFETEKIDFTPVAGANVSVGGMDGDSDDPMLQQAIDLVMSNERVSISLVQRHLRIGYNRAARLVESMERSGIVSPMDSAGNRKLLTRADTKGS